MTTHHLPTPARFDIDVLDVDVLDVDALAHAVAADGVDAHEHAVQTLASSADPMTVGPATLAVLTDRSASPVARERALGRVLERLAHAVPRSVGHHEPPSSIAA